MHKITKFILFFLFSLSPSCVANALELSVNNVKFNTAYSNPITVLFGIYLFNIGNFKLNKGCYEMLFYLLNRCQPVCSKVHFFPFHRHQLTLVFEDKFLEKNNLEFSTYPAYHQTYSRYIFSVNIYRPVLAGLLKNILPATLLMFMVFFPLFIGDSTKIISGLSLTGGALITLAFISYQFNVCYSTYTPHDLHGYATWLTLMGLC